MAESRRRTLAAIVGSLLVLLGCSSTLISADDDGSRLQAKITDQSSPSPAADSNPDDETTTTTPQLAELTTAEAFRVFVDEADDMPPDVDIFARTASDAELEQLAATACSLIEPDMTAAELGTVTFIARGQLSDEQQALLDIADFGVVFGAIAGLTCPQRLPIGSKQPVQQRDQSAIDDYRHAMLSFWPTEHTAARFVAMVTDGRLHELQQSACTFSSVDQTGAEFGTAAMAHYRAELTATERDAIALDTYPEVYGSLVAWFCTERLPTTE